MIQLPPLILEALAESGRGAFARLFFKEWDVALTCELAPVAVCCEEDNEFLVECGARSRTVAGIAEVPELPGVLALGFFLLMRLAKAEVLLFASSLIDFGNWGIRANQHSFFTSHSLQ